MTTSAVAAELREQWDDFVGKVYGKRGFDLLDGELGLGRDLSCAGAVALSFGGDRDLAVGKGSDFSSFGNVDDSHRVRRKRNTVREVYRLFAVQWER